MIWRQYTILIVEVALALVETTLLIVALNVFGKDASRTKMQKIGKSLEIIFIPLFGPLFYLLAPKKKNHVVMTNLKRVQINCAYTKVVGNAGGQKNTTNWT
jgi:hypothetical protein